jgi:hypothetical protein
MDQLSRTVCVPLFIVLMLAIGPQLCVCVCVCVVLSTRRSDVGRQATQRACQRLDNEWRKGLGFKGSKLHGECGRCWPCQR